MVREHPAFKITNSARQPGQCGGWGGGGGGGGAGRGEWVGGDSRKTPGEKIKLITQNDCVKNNKFKQQQNDSNK